ncbi:HTH domain-containing protein [Listeria kieliensis]
MYFANLKDNIQDLKTHYGFTDKDFLKYFGLSFDELMEIQNDGDVRYGNLVEKSAFLTEPFRDADAEERLKLIIESLHVEKELSYQTIAAYAQLEEKELIDYSNGTKELFYEQKFNSCSRLTLLDTFLNNCLNV